MCREVPGTDVSSSVETDKENETMDDTDQLLDSTYNLESKLNITKTVSGGNLCLLSSSSI